MRYIPSKSLFKAVMWALDMCGHDLQTARDDKVSLAASYYNECEADVLDIVQEELWEKARSKASGDDEWYTIFNPSAPKVLGLGRGMDYVFICPDCGMAQACNVHDEAKADRIFVSPCPRCGFVDRFQREVIRPGLYKKLTGGKP